MLQFTTWFLPHRGYGMTIRELVGRTPTLLLLQIKQTAALCGHLRLGPCMTLAKHFQCNQTNAAKVSIRVSIAQYAHRRKKGNTHFGTALRVFLSSSELGWKADPCTSKAFLSPECSVNAATFKFASICCRLWKKKMRMLSSIHDSGSSKKLPPNITSSTVPDLWFNSRIVL